MVKIEIVKEYFDSLKMKDNVFNISYRLNNNEKYFNGCIIYKNLDGLNMIRVFLEIKDNIWRAIFRKGTIYSSSKNILIIFIDEKEVIEFIDRKLKRE